MAVGREEDGMMKVNRGRKSISAECLVKKQVLVLKYLSNGGTIIDKKDVTIKHRSWCYDDFDYLRAKTDISHVSWV